MNNDLDQPADYRNITGQVTDDGRLIGYILVHLICKFKEHSIKTEGIVVMTSVFQL